MTAERDSIEVFQELAVRSPTFASESEVLRRELISQRQSVWAHSKDLETKMSSKALAENEFLAFERAADETLPAAGLVLWSRPDGYEITNIVPKEYGQLGISKYNALLREFARMVAEPAAKATGFTLEITPDRQSLEDWTSPSAAQALRQFSSMANKSTGASHPLDHRRWLRFLIAAHRSERDLPGDMLQRWLMEIEHWDDEHAQKLVSQYEFARDLLQEYDSLH